MDFFKTSDGSSINLFRIDCIKQDGDHYRVFFAGATTMLISIEDYHRISGTVPVVEKKEKVVKSKSSKK